MWRRLLRKGSCGLPRFGVRGGGALQLNCADLSKGAAFKAKLISVLRSHIGDELDDEDDDDTSGFETAGVGGTFSSVLCEVASCVENVVGIGFWRCMKDTVLGVIASVFQRW